MGGAIAMLTSIRRPDVFKGMVLQVPMAAVNPDIVPNCCVVNILK